MTKKLIYIFVCTFLICLLIYKLAIIYSPGSYPFAIKYKIALNFDDLKNDIEIFKKMNNSKQLPLSMQNDFVDEYIGENKQMYRFNLYFEHQNEVMFIWISRLNKNESILALVSIKDVLKAENWKELNNDLNLEQTKLKKENFENEILKKLNVKFDIY